MTYVDLVQKKKSMFHWCKMRTQRPREIACPSRRCAEMHRNKNEKKYCVANDAIIFKKMMCSLSITSWQRPLLVTLKNINLILYLGMFYCFISESFTRRSGACYLFSIRTFPIAYSRPQSVLAARACFE